MRVVHVVTRLNFGGVTRHLINLYRNLPADRVDMRIVTGVVADGEAEWTDAIREARLVPWTISELRRPIAPIDDLVAIVKLWRLFRRWKPDVVHTHMSKAGAIGRIAALLAGVPVRVRTFHGHPFHTYFGSLGSWAARTFERVLGYATTGVITVTTGQHQEIVRDLRIIPERRTRTISYGCEAWGPVEEGVRETWRRQFGIDPDAFVVASVGRLTPLKNFEMLLDAVARCRASITVVIGGDGEHRASLEQRAADLAIADRTIFTGRIADANVVYQIGDVVAMTSRTEGAPIVIMEAMGCGRPVVATRVGGVPDMFDPSCGILVDVDDVDRLAEALDTLAGDPARVRRMGAAAYARAKTQFSVEREAEAVLEFYEALLAE